LIFGRKYNGTDPYWYSKHLWALKKNWIITVTEPDLKETRWFVMLMLKRTYDSWLVQENRLSTSAINWSRALE
jgi:hypothetical protein